MLYLLFYCLNILVLVRNTDLRVVILAFVDCDIYYKDIYVGIFCCNSLRTCLLQLVELAVLCRSLMLLVLAVVLLNDSLWYLIKLHFSFILCNLL